MNEIFGQVITFAIPALLGIAGAVFGFLQDRAAKRKSKETEKRVNEIEIKATKEPERVKFAWDLARIKLEAYFDRNLDQVKSISSWPFW